VRGMRGLYISADTTQRRHMIGHYLADTYNILPSQLRSSSRPHIGRGRRRFLDIAQGLTGFDALAKPSLELSVERKEIHSRS
jgi:hypothetical protein